MSGFGRDAQWYRNVRAGGAAEVAIGRRRFAPHVRFPDDEEAAGIVGHYERRNRLAAPLVRFVLSRLAGFRYDGSGDARLALVRRLPLVAFRPRAVPGAHAGPPG